MGLRIVLADPRDLIRKGLRELLTAFPIVEHIDEVATVEALQGYLSAYSIDLAIIHQAFISEINVLPKEYFLIVATQGGTDISLTALNREERRYELAQDMQVLLQGIVGIAEKQDERILLIDPVLTFNAFGSERNANPAPVDLSILTSQEYRVLMLLQDGLGDEQIAEKLCTTEGTVRSHISHIVRKLDLNRKQLKRLTLPKRIDDNER